MTTPNLNVPLPGMRHTKRYTRRWMREEIDRHSPATLLLRANNRCVEVTLELFFSLLRQEE